MKKPSFLLFFLLLFISQLTGQLFAQGKTDTVVNSYDTTVQKKLQECPQKEIFDVMLKRFGDKSLTYKKFTILGLPYVGYNPVTSIQIGAGASLSWYLGDPLNTKLSAATVSAQVTFNKQVIIQAKSNVFTRENKWFLQGDWRFYIFNLSTYGLGTESGYNIPPVPGYAVDPEAEAETNGIYGMDFNWFKFHQVVSRKIRNHLYAGIGYHFDAHYNIKDTQLKLDTPDVVMAPHYAYCQLHGFDPEEYISSGLSLNCIFDTRDNIINPYRGIYVNVNYRYNFKGLGSAAAGSKLWTEFRSYVSLSKRMPRHLIAFWFYGSFMVSGVVPYLDLPATGFDQMNSSGRGYDQGRWRGEDFVYGEVEYRFPISQCSQILGGVVFVNATTASNRDMGVSLFEAVRPAIGAGLRIMVSKRNRINLLIDFAIGQKSNGFYVQAQEAF